MAHSKHHLANETFGNRTQLGYVSVGLAGGGMALQDIIFVPRCSGSMALLGGLGILRKKIKRDGGDGGSFWHGATVGRLC